MENLSFPIPQPPWTGIGKKLESLCRKALFDYQMLEGVNKLAVALSGGKDSLSLLFLLSAISGRGFPKIELFAIHISGEFSCGAGVEQKFLQKVCDGLGIPLVIREATQKKETLACYSCSRERRKLLFTAAKELGCREIAFGHHREDSVQTLLLNLLHKGEFAGNLPKLFMREYGVTILRPLIYVPELYIKEFAKMYGFARITCQCPVGQNSKRKVVEKLLGAMEVEFPNVRGNLAQAIKQYGSNKAATP